MMRRLPLPWIFLTALLGACETDERESDLAARLVAALPTEEQLALAVPESPAGKPGDKSDSRYLASMRSIGALVDGSIKATLKPVRAVLRAQAKHRGKRLVWSADDAGDRFLLAAEELPDGRIRYSAAVRRGTEWRPYLAATVTPGRRGGQGAVWVDLRHKSSPKAGRLLVLYDVRSPVDRTITVYAYGVTDLDGDSVVPGARPSRVFHYQGSRAEGVLLYALDAFDIEYDEKNRLNPEQVVVASRWRGAGGRSDFLATGGDVSIAGFARGRGSECWDRVARDVAWRQLIGTREDGTEAVVHEAGDESACVYPDAVPVVLPDPAPPPPDPVTPEEVADEPAP